MTFIGKSLKSKSFLEKTFDILFRIECYTVMASTCSAFFFQSSIIEGSTKYPVVDFNLEKMHSLFKQLSCHSMDQVLDRVSQSSQSDSQLPATTALFRKHRLSIIRHVKIQLMHDSRGYISLKCIVKSKILKGAMLDYFLMITDDID